MIRKKAIKLVEEDVVLFRIGSPFYPYFNSISDFKISEVLEYLIRSRVKMDNQEKVDTVLANINNSNSRLDAHPPHSLGPDFRSYNEVYQVLSVAYAEHLLRVRESEESPSQNPASRQERLQNTRDTKRKWVQYVASDPGPDELTTLIEK